ncbi:nucleotidyltransferase domain-containing protein [Longimicrobium sp.]|uniref:nucleotidyltransferase domain-containing protein n=1 Tax=Longimicrobium sp. TaxID=2029185 RepID=UPI002E3177B7|nr:nucleotidyltransferase domain-containing protein [Longimicrobium sp.]HEX6042211.1 nucleotidyltransferase domain-containing protein [Longimicrobium sp.]
MANGTLHNLLPGGTLKLVTHFVLHPEDRLHFRALKQRTGLGTGSLQRELARLEGMELIARSEEGGKVFYTPLWERDSWRAFRTLLREHADPVEVVRDALIGVSGIKAAFVYGSTVRGDTRPDSDIDLFIVEEEMPLHEIGRATTEAESLLDRLIDISAHTPASLRQKLERGSSYLLDVLSGPKAWVIGSEDLLPVT